MGLLKMTGIFISSIILSTTFTGFINSFAVYCSISFHGGEATCLTQSLEYFSAFRFRKYGWIEKEKLVAVYVLSLKTPFHPDRHSNTATFIRMGNDSTHH